MPEVPTYRGQPSLLGAGGIRARSTPYDFGQGLADEGQGLSTNLSRAAQTVNVLSEQRKVLADDQWVNDAMTKARAHISPWMADPENNSKDTYAGDLMDMSMKLGNEYANAAPSKDAAKR